MEGLFAAVELEDQLTDRLPGTRLQRIEVWNSGTFSGRVWSFDVGVTRGKSRGCAPLRECHPIRFPQCGALACKLPATRPLP
jgi:hypothetical protein